MPLLSIFGTPSSFAVIMPNIKSCEADLEFLVSDARADNVTNEKSGIFKVGAPSKYFLISRAPFKAEELHFKEI